MKEELKKIIEKSTLSLSDKEKVVKYSNALGIPFINTDCPDCHKDQAMILYKKILEDQDAKNEPQPGKELKLRKNVDIIFRSQRVNEFTITPKIKKQMIEAGLTKFFEEDEN